MMSMGWRSSGAGDEDDEEAAARHEEEEDDKAAKDEAGAGEDGDGEKKMAWSSPALQKLHFELRCSTQR
jgi:hypothetical protein